MNREQIQNHLAEMPMGVNGKTFPELLQKLRRMEPAGAEKAVAS